MDNSVDDYQDDIGEDIQGKAWSGHRINLVGCGEMLGGRGS